MQNHPRSNICLLAPAKLFKLLPPFGGVDPAGPLVGVSPQKIKFYQANPPQGATFVCWPPPYSHCQHLHLVESPCGPGVGVSPPKLNFPSKPTLRSNFCLLDLALLLTLQGISDGVSVRGNPWMTFRVAPWLYKLFYKYYIIKFINIIEKLINPIVMPRKHYCYTRSIFYGIGEGGGWVGGDLKAITRTASAVNNFKNLTKLRLSMFFSFFLMF